MKKNTFLQVNFINGKKMSYEEVQKECPVCKGTGKGTLSAFDYHPKCPICEGRGHNEFFEEVMPCKKCNGTGIDNSAMVKNVRYCQICGGAGFIPVKKKG